MNILWSACDEMTVFTFNPEKKIRSNQDNIIFDSPQCHTQSPRPPGEPASLIASYKNVEKVLGWNPKVSLDEIIRSA